MVVGVGDFCNEELLMHTKMHNRELSNRRNPQNDREYDCALFVAANPSVKQASAYPTWIAKVIRIKRGNEGVVPQLRVH